MAKGKKITDFDLTKQPLTASELAAVVLGPTGNLRAPTLRRGKTWIVGFNDELYASQL